MDYRSDRQLVRYIALAIGNLMGTAEYTWLVEPMIDVNILFDWGWIIFRLYEFFVWNGLWDSATSLVSTICVSTCSVWPQWEVDNWHMSSKIVSFSHIETAPAFFIIWSGTESLKPYTFIFLIFLFPGHRWRRIVVKFVLTEPISIWTIRLEFAWWLYCSIPISWSPRKKNKLGHIRPISMVFQ